MVSVVMTVGREATAAVNVVALLRARVRVEVRLMVRSKAEAMSGFGVVKKAVVARWKVRALVVRRVMIIRSVLSTGMLGEVCMSMVATSTAVFFSVRQQPVQSKDVV
jgi:hypothetical protein